MSVTKLNNNSVVKLNSNSIVNGQKTYSVMSLVSSVNSTYSKVITEDNFKEQIFRAFKEMDSKDMAKLLYICLNKLLDKKEQEKLETLLKMCNNYETVVKQIVKI